jgi:hypothetical protein
MEYDRHMTDRAARALGKKRWAGKTEEEKRAHSEAMNRARWGPKKKAGKKKGKKAK